MSKATTLEVPSPEVCDRIAIVTEEGLELEARLLAFARDAGEVVRAFDSEVEPLALDERKLDRATVRCGLGVLHALTERMIEALVGVVGDTEEEMAA